jgi:hypothetical protein
VPHNYNPRRSLSVLKCQTLVGAASIADPRLNGPLAWAHVLGSRRAVHLFETRPERRRYAQANCSDPCRFAVLLCGGCSRACPVRGWCSREETGSTTARPGDPARRDPHRVARWKFADGCSAVASGEQELDGATSRMVRSRCRRRGRSCLGRRFMQRWLLPDRCRRRSDCRIVVRSRRGCVDRLGGRPRQVARSRITVRECRSSGRVLRNTDSLTNRQRAVVVMGSSHWRADKDRGYRERRSASEQAVKTAVARFGRRRSSPSLTAPPRRHSVSRGHVSVG